METQLVVPGVHLLPFEIGQAYVWQWGDNLTIIDTGITGLGVDHPGGDLGLWGDAPRTCGRLCSRISTRTTVAEPSSWCSERGKGDRPSGRRAGHPRRAGRAPPVLTEAERPLADAIFPRVPPAQPVDVNREVGEGDTTEGGGRIVDAPGHTPGSLALLLPGQSVLFTGDCIACAEGKPILGPFNIDRSASMASARKLAELGCEVACFGHGPPLVGDASRKLRTLADPLGSGPTGSQGSANP